MNNPNVVWSQDNFIRFQTGVNLMVVLCVVAVFVAVIIDFAEFHRRNNIRAERRSVVATGTMVLFFVGFYWLIRMRVAVIRTDLWWMRFLLSGGGLTILILGCLVNIKGRFNLGRNWSNQIKIYEDHQLVRTGAYRWVRHPLYASIIWMFYGACLIQMNLAAFIATTFIFVPFMYFRARQEERLLTEQFPEYREYRAQTGMFFPKIIG